MGRPYVNASVLTQSVVTFWPLGNFKSFGGSQFYIKVDGGPDKAESISVAGPRPSDGVSPS